MEKIIKMYNEYIKLAEKRISFLENEIALGKDCEGDDQKDLDQNYKHLASLKIDLAELEGDHTKEIVGHYEAAEILGWQKQQVTVYMQRGKFPEPLQKLKSTPIWLKEDIQKFKESRMKMKRLDVTKMNGKMYKLPEGYYAIEGRFGDQVYRDDNGKNVTQQIMGGNNKDDIIILTDKGIEKLKLVD